MPGRTPHGVRGLKSDKVQFVSDGKKSHPTRGAWIEISSTLTFNVHQTVAPHTGCVD